MIVMEFLDGRTLAETIPKGGMQHAMPWPVARQIAEALAPRTSAGIIHRDLKPANLMVTAAGVVKLLDFGLAKFKVAASDQTLTLATQAGTLLGTIGYMSPEQAQGQPTDARTDIFSFGAVLYEMLTGERAFTGESPAAVLGAILRDEPRLLSRLSSGWNTVARRCLEKDPALRFASMDEVQTAIATAASGAAVPVGPSIVVLPFTNLSPDKENEYFGDGLTEEIIGSLSHVSGLRVIARASSFRLRGETDLAKVGRMLHVAHTLDGSVRKAGNRVRISVQLSRIADETPLWSERFDRDMTDIFAIQDEIAAAVVTSLEARLMKPQPANRPDVTAYTLGLRAQQLMWRVSGNSIHVAEQLYEEAIRLDPNFAAAYAGLASCLVTYAILGSPDSKGLLMRSRDLGSRAVALDPNRAEGYTWVADGHAFLERDWASAGAAHRRALELNPASFEVSVGYAIHYLRVVGKVDEAIIELRRVLDSDPLSAPALSLLGVPVLEQSTVRAVGPALYPCAGSGRCQCDCAVVSRVEPSRARGRI